MLHYRYLYISSVYFWFLFKKITFSPLLASRAALFLVNTSSTVLNSSSLGTRLTGIPRMYCARIAKTGKWCPFLFNQPKKKARSHSSRSHRRSWSWDTFLHHLSPRFWVSKISISISKKHQKWWNRGFLGSWNRHSKYFLSYFFILSVCLD